MTAKQCWAYGPSKTRCDLEAGHDGDHAVRQTWTDAQCIEPTVTVLAPPPSTSGILTNSGRSLTPGRVKVPVKAAPGDDVLAEALAAADQDDDDEMLDLPPAPCFSCGCPADDHPCDPHGCRAYVP